MWQHTENTFLNKESPLWRFKRKSDFETDIMPPLKMLITEEKMVSQLNGIHLSNNFTSHGTSPIPEESNTKPLEMPSTSQPSLRLSDEVIALNNAYKFNMLPDSLVHKFSKPTNALVLWQPPMGSIARTISSAFGSSSSEEESEASPEQPPPPQVPEVVDVEMNEDDDNNNNLSLNGPHPGLV